MADSQADFLMSLCERIGMVEDDVRVLAKECTSRLPHILEDIERSLCLLHERVASLSLGVHVPSMTCKTQDDLLQDE